LRAGPQNAVMLGWNRSAEQKSLPNPDLREDHGERFDQDNEVTEERYEGRWDAHMTADYCRNLQCDYLAVSHSRKSYKRKVVNTKRQFTKYTLIVTKSSMWGLTSAVSSLQKLFLLLSLPNLPHFYFTRIMICMQKALFDKDCHPSYRIKMKEYCMDKVWKSRYSHIKFVA